MLKNLLLKYSIYSFLLNCSMSYAQDFGAQLFLGANFSQVDGDQMGGYNKLGANVGIQINRPINNDWESAFEIRYSMKGSKKVIDPEGPPTPTLDLNYHYLEVPLLVKYLGWEKIEPYGGLSLGVNIFNERDDNGRKRKELKLKKTEIIHHINEDKLDNRLENLDLCETKSVHQKAHHSLELM